MQAFLKSGPNFSAKLEDYARALGIQKYVVFHGHVSQVAPLIKQLDIVVCASHIEPFGLCLIEGMACQKPIVATRVGGIPEVVEDGKTGLLVPPHAPEALANAVAELLDSPELRRKMGQNGRRRVEQYFSCAAYTAGIMQIYQELIKQ